MDYYNLKTDFGAIGDGITNDYSAIMNFVNTCMTTSKPGYIPPGHYLSSTRITINADLQPTSRTGLRLFGAGAHSSIFIITDSVAPSFHVYKASGDVFSYVELSDFGIECDSEQGLVLCLSDLSDFIGNGVFKNLHVYNSNNHFSDTAVACQINYIFDCIVENCVFLTGTTFDYGVALELRNPKFTVFNGNSYSNARYGILFSDSGPGRGCENLTFNSADFENTNYCIRNVNTFTRNIIFNAPYFDNRRPNTAELGVACISSPAYGKKGCLIVNNPEFAIPGTGLYPDLDRAIDIYNSNPGAIVINGYYDGYNLPEPSTSPYMFENGPQTAVVNLSKGDTCTTVLINGKVCPGTTFILNSGDTIYISWFGEGKPIITGKILY